MMDQNRITDYINSLDSGHGELCDRIAREARAAFVPIIRRETAVFLQTMITAVKPLRILEVGTAVGYSALLMAQVMPEQGHITTIEKYEPRIPLARAHFQEAGMDERITLLEGDAEEILKQLDGPFDFIFMDAAKGQYIHWLPRILELMADGAVLFSDNVLQDGDIIESRFAVERRNRTIHSRMRDYLYTLTHMEELKTSILPIGDGVTLSVKQTKDIFDRK
ncbi:MAG: O-methyltransferase [Eubacteriales bacterium]|nr:O-methyltransferase [Eubacteriales bacterium]